MKSQTEVVEQDGFRKVEATYELFIWDYCKRQCTIITKTHEKPLSCPFLDEYIPMPWKDQSSVKTIGTPIEFSLLMDNGISDGPRVLQSRL
jgi:hypothetical protein